MKKNNVQIQIFNYTTDELHVFDLNEKDKADLKIEELKSKNQEVDVNFIFDKYYFDYNDENFEFVEEHDNDDLESVLIFFRNNYFDAPSCINLQEVWDYMLDEVSTYWTYGRNESDAFETLCEELELLDDLPEKFLPYIDFEKMLRDHKFNGMSVYELKSVNNDYESLFMFIWE